MARPHITAENARIYALRAHEARKKNLLARKAEEAAAKAGMVALMPSEIAPAPKAEEPAYFQKRLTRVREQLDRLDEMMLREESPQAIDRLAAASARLAEQERIMDGRPLPGSHRPSKAPRKSTASGDVMPE